MAEQGVIVQWMRDNARRFISFAGGKWHIDGYSLAQAACEALNDYQEGAVPTIYFVKGADIAVEVEKQMNRR